MRLKNSNGVYYAIVSVKGKEHSMSTGTASEVKAKEFGIAFEQAVIGNHIKAELEKREKEKNDIKLIDAIERCHKERWIHNRDGSRARIRALSCAEIIGNIYLSDVKSNTLAMLKLKLANKCKSKSTVNRYLATLRTVLHRAAKEWDILASVPSFHLFREPTGRIRIVSPEEEQLLRHYITVDIPNRSESRKNFPEIADLMIALADTGMRLGEALSLKYNDNIDLTSGVIHLHPKQTKTNRPRTLPMTTRVKLMFAKRKGLSVNGCAFTVDKHRVRRAWNWAKKKMNLKDDKEFVPHSLRHTFASRLAMAGCDIYTIKNLLGHTTISTTERYSHLNIHKMSKAISLLETFDFKECQTFDGGNELTELLEKLSLDKD